MNNYVYIAKKSYANIFANPIYISRSVGVADNEYDAHKLAAKFFNIREGYHVSTDYLVEALMNDKITVIGWKVSPIDL